MYLKLLYLGSNSERFSKKISEEINQVLGAVNFRTILYTYRPLSGIYKVILPPKKKVKSSTNLVVTVVVTTLEKRLKGFM